MKRVSGSAIIGLLVALSVFMVSCVNMTPAKDTLLAVSIAVGPLPAVNRAIYEKTTDALIVAIKSQGKGYAEYSKAALPLTSAFLAREGVLLALNAALKQAAQTLEDAKSEAEKKQAIGMAALLVVRASMDVVAAFSDDSALPAIKLPPALQMALSMLRTMVPSNWSQPDGGVRPAADAKATGSDAGANIVIKDM